MRRRVVCPRSHPASLYARRPSVARANSSQYLPGGTTPRTPRSALRAQSLYARRPSVARANSSQYRPGGTTPRTPRSALRAQSLYARRPSVARANSSQYHPGGRPPGPPEARSARSRSDARGDLRVARANGSQYLPGGTTPRAPRSALRARPPRRSALLPVAALNPTALNPTALPPGGVPGLPALTSHCPRASSRLSDLSIDRPTPERTNAKGGGLGAKPAALGMPRAWSLVHRLSG